MDWWKWTGQRFTKFRENRCYHVLTELLRPQKTSFAFMDPYIFNVFAKSSLT